MPPIRCTATWLLILLLHIFGVAPAHAQLLDRETMVAPLLRTCEAKSASDLGTWDDAFVCRDLDFIVLRRGEELYSLPMIGDSTPKKLLKSPAADKTQITAATPSAERLWLFLHSHETAPFALDVNSGEIAKFEIPGLAIPGDQTPGIQSHVIVPHAAAALLMVTAGDKATWPRDGSRPLYFWMDLKSGKVVRFPTGWDLDYFSADQKVAVFAAPNEKPLERRPWQAIEMRTGAHLKETPDRRKELCIPFDWGDKQDVKPLYGRRPKTGDADFFGGLSQHGRALALDIDLEGRQYLAMAKASDGYAGLRLRREGASRGEPGPYWIAPLEKPEKRERVTDGVIDFALLRGGNGVFVTSGHGRKEKSHEAWFHGSDQATWNVLEGVERLPPLDKKFADADYVQDQMTIQLIESFGKREHDPLVVCFCSHWRGDLRALTLFEERKPLESKSWRRAIALTSAGQRCLTPLFREGEVPELIWLHHSGKLILGKYAWWSVGETRERQVQLTETVLQLPREDK